MRSLRSMLDKAIEVIEWFVVLGLVVLSLSAAFTLSVELYHLATGGFLLPTTTFNKLIGTMLEIFILVELFRIAMAYMEHADVVPTVMEAALVAVARKFVVFEGADRYLEHAAALAVLLIAVALSWWLLGHSRSRRAGSTRPAAVPIADSPE